MQDPKYFKDMQLLVNGVPVPELSDMFAPLSNVPEQPARRPGNRHMRRVTAAVLRKADREP